MCKGACQLLLQRACQQSLVGCLLGALLAFTRKLLLVLLVVLCLLQPVKQARLLNPAAACTQLC